MRSTRKGFDGPSVDLFCLTLLQVGVTKPEDYSSAGELLPHRSILALKAVFVSMALTEGLPSRVLPGTLPLESGLSSGYYPATTCPATIHFLPNYTKYRIKLYLSRKRRLTPAVIHGTIHLEILIKK